MARMQTFEDIIDAILEDLGVQSTDTLARNKVKRMVNMCYIDEVVPFKRWDWLKKTVQVVHNEYYNTGDAAVTPDSTTVTLSVAPNVALGSFKGRRFSVDGNNQLYTISAHTAGSATLTLSSAYQEALDAAADYKIWRDRFDLPTDAKETIEITHAERRKPLEAVGPQGFRKYEAAGPKTEGYPSVYHTGDFYDPSADDDETESDRYRQTLIWPSISQYPVTLNVDYVQEATELEDDADEPLMPISDRIILFYGAGAMAWSTINRNEEMFDKRWAMYQQKLARMAGEREDGMDTPSLSPKSSYLNNIRRSGLKRRELSVAAQGSGGSSVAMPSYLAGVTINGATITGNVTVSDEITIDGRDLSEDGDLLDTLVNPNSVTLTDNTTNQAAALFDLTDYDVAHIQYTIKRGTDREIGSISLMTDGSAVRINQYGVQNIGDVGVTLTADVSGGNLRLLSTTTSTGSNATFKYRAFKWLA